MQVPEQIAIITASATAFGLIVGAGSALLSEWLRHRHELKRTRLVRELEEAATREQELRDAFAVTRAAVLRFTLTIQIFLDLRRDPSTEIVTGDRIHQLRKARTDYLAASVAIEALWALAPEEEARQAAEALQALTAGAYGVARSPGDPAAAPESIEPPIRNGLRMLSRHLFPVANATQAGPAAAPKRRLRLRLRRSRKALSSSDP
jgi:hypothetical protein